MTCRFRIAVGGAATGEPFGSEEAVCVPFFGW